MTKDEMRRQIVETVRDLYDKAPEWANTGWDDGTGEIADRILALMPDADLAEIGRLAVEADKSPSIVNWSRAVRAEAELHSAIAAYLAKQERADG